MAHCTADCTQQQLPTKRAHQCSPLRMIPKDEQDNNLIYKSKGNIEQCSTDGMCMSRCIAKAS